MCMYVFPKGRSARFIYRLGVAKVARLRVRLRQGPRPVIRVDRLLKTVSEPERHLRLSIQPDVGSNLRPHATVNKPRILNLKLFTISW